MKILHTLSQRPDSTGSGIYLQSIIHEATCAGDSHSIVAGLPFYLEPELRRRWNTTFFPVLFETKEMPFLIPGMSDVMPYPSSRWSGLSPEQLHIYKSRFTEKLQKAVRTFQPDIIHTHHLWILTALTRRLFPDLPVVTTCHGSDLRQFVLCRHLQTEVLSGCRELDRVMALSESQKTKITALYNIPHEKIAVVGAGYNDLLFRPGVKPGPDPVGIVYAGKLSRAKGVPWLLKALGQIDTPAWQLHLVGSGTGEEAAECEELAGKLGERVLLYGSVPQHELAEIMRKSHIFILPSFFEGLPLVLLEALACGCSIIATRLSGVEELLGKLEDPRVALLELPRLVNVDQPHKDDQDAFTSRIRSALVLKMKDMLAHHDTESKSIADRLKSYKWSAVYRRIRTVYSGAVGLD